MSEEVVCVRMKESVEYIINILKNTSYHGFPVVDQVDDINRRNGRLRGFILRTQLIVILKRSFFEETKRFWEQKISIEAFRDEYPRFPCIDDIKLSNDKLAYKYTINMEIFMNPSPYKVNQATSVPRIFMLFRALGLRHLSEIHGRRPEPPNLRRACRDHGRSELRGSGVGHRDRHDRPAAASDPPRPALPG